MLLVHGAWGVERTGGDAAFLIWAEDTESRRTARPKTVESSGPYASPADASAAVALVDSTPAHPFQATGLAVRTAIKTLVAATGRDSGPLQAPAASWVIRLPTRDGQPLSSQTRAGSSVPDVELEPPNSTSGTEDRAPIVLAPWQVRGRALVARSAAWMLALLSAPSEGGTDNDLDPGVALGADVRYWSAVAKFALELVARERFVPTLEMRDTARARWRAVLSDPRDASRFALLARAMPAVCRAVGEGDRALAAGAVLSRALGSIVDAFVVDGVTTGADDDGSLHRRFPRPTSAADAWLFALVEGRSAVREGGYDLGAFAERVAAWVAPVAQVAAAESFRTCFRLEPPDDGNDNRTGAPKADSRVWRLRFLLQAADDPSLLVPAERVWQERGDALLVLKRRLDLPQERLLADLGRAAQLFPPIEAGLAEVRPTECLLTTAEAYEFLREAAPLLEESGFGVLVPSWWERQGSRRLGVRVRIGTDRIAMDGTANGQFGQDSLVDFDWKLALGDQELEPAEFKRLARLKVPLVRVRGQWVELDARKIEQAIAFWEKRRKGGPLEAAEALRLALGPSDAPGLPVVDVDAGGWLGELLGQASDGGTPRPLEPSAAFHGQLRDYQARGAAWLRFLADHGLGGCLADDMGLGKTIEYIAFLTAFRDAELRNGEPAIGTPEPGPLDAIATRDLRGARTDAHRPPALLVCPTSVLGNWRHELARFAPDLRVYVHHGTQRLLGERFVDAVSTQDLVLTTYPLTYRDEATLRQVAWSGVVLDEAQNVKNPATRQARAVRSLCRSGTTRPYRFALTGTPVENRLSELWSILDFLNPGYLGSYEAFRRVFVLPIERWQSAERTEQLRRLVRPFILRRVKTDPRIIQDLPEKLELKVYCTLTREQATLYQAVVEQMLGEIEEAEGIERRGRVLAALLRLKQICNHPASFLSDGSPLPGRSGKLARLEEMLEEVLAEGDAALIFTQFAEFGGRLADYLRTHLGREVLFLHGGTPARSRDAMVARFQQADGPPLFLLSLKAGGIGLNLTRATHVFHYDRWWNPAVEDQATDRAFRIGQHRNVQVHKFLCAGTLEERIDELIQSKQALASQVIGSGETWLTELDTGELRELMALRAEAIVDE